MLSSGGSAAFCTDNLPQSDLRCHKTNHLGLCDFRHAIERKPAILLGFGKYPLFITALGDAANVDL